MKITVFTSNQPRHISLIESLASLADQVFAVQECTTIFPGQVDDFFKRSEVMQKYFTKVLKAEKEVFGSVRFVPKNVRTLNLKLGDLNKIPMELLKPALQSDIYVVFGSSYIKGPLCDFLVSKKALNIHMGISPYYRGASCNFWAPYDGRPEYVGATIHLLSKGLDSGPMLFHAFPKPQKIDPFLLGMLAVQSAHKGLVAHLKKNRMKSLEPVAQNKSLEIRYTRSQDFTDERAAHYLDNLLSKEEIFQKLNKRNLSQFLRPFVV